MSEIRNGEENIRAINNYSEKNLQIHVEDEEEEKGDTGDEEVEGGKFLGKCSRSNEGTETVVVLLRIKRTELNVQRYTKPTEDESSSNSLDVLQRSRIDLYLNCNSKEELRSTR
uniref:Uncharacterized protein n=1 Tax=Vespula pensylvanica TaxID=30213 RepID=A0A834JM20_VESPE|nr:hypothetical protein H0235_017607 [Vespula pensylvanica]